MTTQMTMPGGPQMLDSIQPAWIDRLLATRQTAEAALQTLFRVPKPDDDMPEDLRRLLEEDEAFDDRDEHDDRPSGAPKAGWSAGMALCLPSLALIGLLYSLLK